MDGLFIRSPATDPTLEHGLGGLPVGNGSVDGRRRLLRTNPAEAATVVAEVLRRWANQER